MLFPCIELSPSIHAVILWLLLDHSDRCLFLKLSKRDFIMTLGHSMKQLLISHAAENRMLLHWIEIINTMNKGICLLWTKNLIVCSKKCNTVGVDLLDLLHVTVWCSRKRCNLSLRMWSQSDMFYPLVLGPWVS